MFKLLIRNSRNLLNNKLNNQSNNISRKLSSIYEPDYLESLKPKFPVYNQLNFQIKGYDYTILESYQSFIHNVAESMNLEVSECWASPPKHLQIQRFKPSSAIVETDFKLTVYERNLQINEMLSPLYPIFLQISQAALPEGVTLNVLEHSKDQEEFRYVPDRDLLELRSQLDGMVPAKKKRT